MEEALDGEGVQSVSRKALRERLVGSEYLAGCLFGPCLKTLRGVTGVPVVLVAQIRGEGSSYSFLITLIDTKTGMFTSQISQACAVCTIEEALFSATLATISLLTGSGGAKIAPEEAAPVPSPKNLTKVQMGRSVKRRMRTSSLIFLGLGAAAGLGGALLLASDHRDLGVVGISSGTGLFAGGATMLLLSRQF